MKKIPSNTGTKAQLDYVRFACWNDKIALDLMSRLRRENKGEFHKSKWLQYNGWRSSSMYYGTGEQNGVRHYVFEQSGEDSNYLATIALDIPELYCTRIDMQITIEEPTTYDPFITYTEQKSISGRASSIIHSDTGSTIYIGSRQGETFARLYQKQYDDRRWLRLEFEIKSKAAKAVWMQLAEGITVDDMYQHYLNKVKTPNYIKKWFDTDNAKEISLDIIRVVSADKQLKWLSSLEGTVVKMGNDHYQGNTVKALLERWLSLIDKKDINI